MDPQIIAQLQTVAIALKKVQDLQAKLEAAKALLQTLPGEIKALVTAGEIERAKLEAMVRAATWKDVDPDYVPPA